MRITSEGQGRSDVEVSVVEGDCSGSSEHLCVSSEDVSMWNEGREREEED